MWLLGVPALRAGVGCDGLSLIVRPPLPLPLLGRPLLGYRHNSPRRWILQSPQSRPARVQLFGLASTGFQIAIHSTVGTKPPALFPADGIAGKAQEDLFPDQLPEIQVSGTFREEMNLSFLFDLLVPFTLAITRPQSIQTSAKGLSDRIHTASADHVAFRHELALSQNLSGGGHPEVELYPTQASKASVDTLPKGIVGLHDRRDPNGSRSLQLRQIDPKHSPSNVPLGWPSVNQGNTGQSNSDPVKKKAISLRAFSSESEA